jgi:DNA (cytosine-5)-methyltransferase 1
MIPVGWSQKYPPPPALSSLSIEDWPAVSPFAWTLRDLPPAPLDAPTVLSTFSCGGGSSMGYKLAGCRVVGAVDIDPRMMGLYVDNLHPPQHLIGSITEVAKSPALIDSWSGVDILDGSPPCTTFSLAGPRERAWGKAKKFAEGAAEQVLDRLFFDYLDLVDVLRPKVFIAENVPGILAGNARGYVKQIITTARGIGYDVQLWDLRADDYGTPQARRRIFFIGRRRDLDLPPVELPKPIRPRVMIADVFYDLLNSGTPQDFLLTDRMRVFWNLARPGQDGDGLENPYNKQNKYGFGFSQRKAPWNGVVPTLVSSCASDFHPFQKRFISTKEHIRAGGFPDDYEGLDSRTLSSRVLGMSVPPQLMAAVARGVCARLASP